MLLSDFEMAMRFLVHDMADAQPPRPEASSSDESYSLYSLSLEALHLLFIGCSIAETCFYVFVDGAKRAHSHQRAHIRHLHIKSNMFANISLAILNSSITTEKTPP